MPKSHPPTVIFETFTPKTLAKFDGKDDGRVLLAINGTVFDVTAGEELLRARFVNKSYSVVNYNALRRQRFYRRTVWQLRRARCVARNGQAIF